MRSKKPNWIASLPDPACDEILPLEEAAKILTSKLGKGWSASAIRDKIAAGKLRQKREYFVTDSSTVINVSNVLRTAQVQDWPT